MAVVMDAFWIGLTCGVVGTVSVALLGYAAYLVYVAGNVTYPPPEGWR